MDAFVGKDILRLWNVWFLWNSALQFAHTARPTPYKVRPMRVDCFINRVIATSPQSVVTWHRIVRTRMWKLIFRFPKMLSKAAVGTVECEVSCCALLDQKTYIPSHNQSNLQNSPRIYPLYLSEFIVWEEEENRHNFSCRTESTSFSEM
jgi:hypothetical protein